MANALFAHCDLSDQASITAGSVNASFPESYLQTLDLPRKWRSNGLSDLYLVFDLGVASDVNFFALVATNASATASWRVRLADSEANLTASPIYDSGSLDQWHDSVQEDSTRLPHGRFCFHQTGSVVTARYVRIDITDASNADGYFEAGKAVIAKAHQFTRNVSYPWRAGIRDLSNLRDLPGGQMMGRKRGQYRTQDIAIDFASEDEILGAIDDIEWRAGTANPVIFILDPDEITYLHKQFIYGVLAESNDFIMTAFDIYQKRLRIRGIPG